MRGEDSERAFEKGASNDGLPRNPSISVGPIETGQVHRGGFEPPTSRLSVGCSTRLSYQCCNRDPIPYGHLVLMNLLLKGSG